MATRQEQLEKLQAQVKRLRRAPTLKKARRPDWEDLTKIEAVGESGAAEVPEPEVVAAFQRREGASVARHLAKPVEIPNWLKAKITSRSSPRSVLDYLMERVRRAPSQKALQLAQHILNDLGRRRGGSKTFKETLTPEQVEEIISLSNPE